MHSFVIAMIVAAGVRFIPGSFTPGSQPDGNTVIFDAPRGLIVVDTGRHPSHTQKIIDDARAAGRPIEAVINTHWHLDHIGGNKLIRAAFPNVRIYSSGALNEARTGFLANYRKQLEEMIAKTPDAEQQKAFRAEIDLIDSGAQLAPDKVITRSETKTIAGRKLQLMLDHNAVTAADVWVFDPKSRVVAAGDLVTLPAPFLDTACATRWSAELARIDKTKFRVLIPGHGAPMNHAEFASYRISFDRLLACANSDAKKESCVDRLDRRHARNRERGREVHAHADGLLCRPSATNRGWRKRAAPNTSRSTRRSSNRG